MVFGLGKKREIVDLTKNTKQNIPSEGYVKRKTSSLQSYNPPELQVSNQKPEKTPSQEGGFFNFFSSNNDIPPVSSSNVQENSERAESKLNDVLYRLSRLTDRVELLEKKMDRLEREKTKL